MTLSAHGMVRSVEPELLDDLADSDPRAVRARRELRRVNVLMGNPRILTASLAGHVRRGHALKIAEIGAGDGSVMAAVARRLRVPGAELTLVDRAALLSPDAAQTMPMRYTLRRGQDPSHSSPIQRLGEGR